MGTAAVTIYLRIEANLFGEGPYDIRLARENETPLVYRRESSGVVRRRRFTAASTLHGTGTGGPAGRLRLRA